MPSRPKVYYGWWIAWSYFFLNLYWGGALLAGFSALFNPIRDSFGLSATVATVAVSLRQGVAVVGAPLVGYVFDRYGPRALMLVATFTTGGGLSLLVFSHHTWQLFVAFSIASIGFAIFVAGTGPAAMALWFVRRRGIAISLALAGSGVGGFLVRAVVALEAGHGWRTTMAMTVVGLVLIGVPASLVLRHRPEQYGLRPDGDPPEGGTMPSPSGARVPTTGGARQGDFSLGEAVSTRSFWLVVGAHSIMALGTGAVSLFFIPHLVDQGFSRGTAAWTFTALGVTGVVSMMATGSLSDVIERRYLIIAGYLMQGLGLVVFAFATSVWHLVPFVLLFSLGTRASMPVISSLLADYFGTANFGKIQGVLFSAFTAGGAIGPVVAAAVHDSAGTFTPIFVGYAGAAALSMGAIALVRAPRGARAPAPQVS